MNDQLPVNVGYWLLAFTPLVVLLVLLVGLKWKAAQAASGGLFITVILAMLAFRTGPFTMAVATGKGIWDALFILLVIWPALLLYEASEEAGAFRVFRADIEGFTESRLVLVLALGWVFASFMQGIAGFGVPVAVVAPLLVGIGVRPIMAVAIPLIGHAWANLFGTFAVAWVASRQVVEFDNPVVVAVATALLLWVVNLLGGFTIAWMYGRWQAIARAWPIVLVVSLVHGGGQLALAGVNPIIANFIPGTVAIGAIFLLERLPYYSRAETMPTQLFEEEGKHRAEKPRPDYSIHLAIAPYYALIGASLVALVIPPVNEFLASWEVKLSFPAVSTGFGIEQSAHDAYGSQSLLTHPGMLLLIGALFAYAIFRAKGLYREGALKRILSQTAENGLGASIAVIGFVILTRLMDHAGMTDVLARGIAEVSPPLVYVFLANAIGIIGSFMTSSNTSSNILFGPLQHEAAVAASIGEATVMAGQHAGGAIGNAIAPANIVLGTSTANIPGKEGEVLKRTLPFVLVGSVLLGIAAVVLHLVGFG